MRGRRVLTGLLLAAGVAVIPAAAGVAPTTRVSVDSDGGQSAQFTHSIAPHVSGDGGLVAFFSDAPNLVAADGNGQGDVFVHDRESGETRRVNVSSAGEEADGASFLDVAISADGGVVAFGSLATNLVAADTNGRADVFVHELATGETTRVSITSAGAQGTFPSGELAVSADGRVVAFSSQARLVATDTDFRWDVYVHDRSTAQTTRASVAGTGTSPDSDSTDPSLSGDARLVAFESAASNLVPGDTNGVSDVFVHDRETGDTVRASVSSVGAEANGFTVNAALSADGSVVVFTSLASNLVPGDTNGTADVFAHELETGETTRVSVDGAGGEGNGLSSGFSVSADGRLVAFRSSATNLVPGDTNRQDDVFVHDRVTGETVRVSVDGAGGQANLSSDRPALSGDGRFVAFDSRATNLVAGDTNSATDVFVRDRLFVDLEPPAIHTPGDLAVNATGPAGVAVAYDVSATDEVDPEPTVSCSPPSGAVFAIGDTTVACTAADFAGNTASAAFDVHVKGAAEQLRDAIGAVAALGLGDGPAKSLGVKLEHASAALDRGRVEAACGAVGAFVREAEALRHEQLAADGMRIRSVLAC